MLLILISWVYIFFTLVNFGLLAKFILSTTKINELLHLVFGLIIILIISHIWAFYNGFGVLFHSLLLLINFAIPIVFYNHFFTFYRETWKSFRSFKSINKILFIIIFLLILVKSASQGSMLDNETYYVQTIKWLNEYGFVNGVANLHLFLGQNSGWHVLQSVFSFHFLGFDFNDLGSFMLLIFNFYALNKLNQKNDTFNSLVFLPVFNFLLLEFCVVPSPDFGVIFFAILICYLFIGSFKNPEIHQFYLVFIIFLSAMLIKITAIGLVVFPIVLFLKLSSKSLSFHIKSLLLLVGFKLIWVAKNLIISGYPFFPSSFFSDFFNFDYQIPESLYNVSLRKEKLVEFFATPSQIQSLSTWDLFLEWLTYSKISLLLNSSLLLSIIAIPILFFKLKFKSAVWWIYISFLSQLIFLAFTSPQYRFAIHYLMIFALLIIYQIVNQNRYLKKYVFIVLCIFQMIVLVLILFPVRLSQLSTKNYSLQSKKFQVKNLLIPTSNSLIQSDYEIKRLGNLNYFSPIDSIYFWSNGDCDLPCINSRQLDYIIRHIQYRPQLRDSTQLSEGFYSEKISLD